MDQSGNSQSYIEMLCLHTYTKKQNAQKKTTFNPSPRSKIQPYTYVGSNYSTHVWFTPQDCDIAVIP